MALSPTQMTPSMVQRLGKILLVVFGVIFALILCEGGLRLLGIEYPLFHDYDPVVGVKLRPGVKGYYLKEGGGFVSINSDGWRDREHPLQRPPNTLRIAVLGDSFTEAMQVNREEAFWAVMAKKLQNCESLRGRNIEVLNFGISGLGTAQELLVLRHRVWKYSPDLVLLAITTGNDVTDNSKALKQNDYSPYYTYRGNQLVLHDRQTREICSPNQNSLVRRVIFSWGIDKVRLLQVILYSKEILREWWSLQNFARKAHVSGKDRGDGISNVIYQEPITEDWKEAWKVTEGVLLLMRDEIAQKGARFFVVTLTNDIQVDPNPQKRNDFAASQGGDDLFYPDQRLARFCQSHQIPILLLAPPFQKYATQNQVFLHGFGKTLGTGHWNQNGHGLAGQTIARWLCPQLR